MARISNVTLHRRSAETSTFNPSLADRDTWADEMQRDERLLWLGTPDKSLFAFRSTSLAMVLFSLTWCGFAIFWNVFVWWLGAPFFFNLIGLPFVAIGLYMVFGRHIIDYARRQHVRYALTDRYALIAIGETTRKLKRLSLTGAYDIQLIGDDPGTIRFNPGVIISERHQKLRMWDDDHQEFFRIRDAPRVYRLIQEMRSKAI